MRKVLAIDGPIAGQVFETTGRDFLAIDPPILAGDYSGEIKQVAYQVRELRLFGRTLWIGVSEYGEERNDEAAWEWLASDKARELRDAE